MTSPQRPFTAATTKLAYVQAFSRTDVPPRRTSSDAHHLRHLMVSHRRGQHVATPSASRTRQQH